MSKPVRGCTLPAGCVLLASLPGCAATSDPPWWPAQARAERAGPTNVRLFQGLIGVSDLNVLDVDLDQNLGTVQQSELSTMPLIGGAVQYPTRAEGPHLGVEAGSTIGWQDDVAVVRLANGGLVTSDQDLFLADLSCGAYYGLPIGRAARAYLGGGTLVQFGNMEINWDDPSAGPVHENESGFGLGYYLRSGLDLRIHGSLHLGVGVRWMESVVNFGGSLNDLHLQAAQYYLSVSAAY